MPADGEQLPSLSPSQADGTSEASETPDNQNADTFEATAETFKVAQTFEDQNANTSETASTASQSNASNLFTVSLIRMHLPCSFYFEVFFFF